MSLLLKIATDNLVFNIQTQMRIKFTYILLLFSSIAFSQISISSSQVSTINNAGQGDLYLTTDTNQLFIGRSNGAIYLIGNESTPSAVTIFTATGVYTPAAGVKWITVECVGGGGAGGTTPITSNTRCAASGGGGGGAYRKVLITKAQLVGAPFVVTIGTGGTVNLANGAGGNGGITSFGSFVSCGGGVGGAATTAVANAAVSTGGNGGTSTFAGCLSINFLNGGNGETGYSTTAATTRFIKGGTGGNSFFGFGGLANVVIATSGGASTFTLPIQYGGGGAGMSVSSGSTTIKVGQAGAAGVVIITEFF